MSEVSDFVYAPPDVPLTLIHHDAQVVVVNKPAGLLSVPGKGEDRADCLIARLRGVFPEILLVHRLDLDTSGVMVFALTKAAQGALGQQFEKRQTKKIYIARVAGLVEPKAGLVDLPLCVDWPNRPRQHVDHENGRPAQTEWAVVKHGPGETRMRLQPLTGRSHQLRVHMAALGHPILGDPLYAEGAARAHPRLMLHAESLRFRHPDSGKSETWRAVCPF
ncbi:RNA pseudouridine synthase [Fertoebacter nigrum]|uniref:Dual-specificity RNA pseudouridine synthase RluA n=1 Tax=Fertoeibacter niger TaxID=2656921 RepID=A0A8X8GY21_9RHOB|nr:pseudouridine synthase [Fertoeibacter niger]NUB46404.1 RNA pseudouridine synthase [Fertoeibacter niger]